MKILSLILIFLGLSILATEIVNDFYKTKIFYASFNPQKNYSKDTLLVNKETRPSNIGSNKTSWLFKGYCQSDKLKIGISIPMNIVATPNFNRSKIAIWRIKNVNDRIIYRRMDNIINSTFSYEMRQYWTSQVFMITAIPALLYYLRTRRKTKKKNQNIKIPYKSTT